MLSDIGHSAAAASWVSSYEPSSHSATSPVRSPCRPSKRSSPAPRSRRYSKNSAPGMSASATSRRGASAGRGVGLCLPRTLGGRGGDRRDRDPRTLLQAAALAEAPGGVAGIYGLLLAHFAVRSLMYAAAVAADLDPERLSFEHAARGEAKDHESRYQTAICK